MSRKRPRVRGRQLQSEGPTISFFFCFIVKPRVSAMLFHHFDFRSGTDHLPLLRLCSIRRNVRKAQWAFAAEAGNVNCSAQSPVIWLMRTAATHVTFSNRHPFR